MTLSSIHNYKISSVYYRIRQHIRKKANCFLSRWNSGKKRVCQCRRLKRCGFDPWVRKIPQSRKWQPTPVFLPRKFHGQKNLVGYRPWGHKESETTEHSLSTQPSTCHRNISVDELTLLFSLISQYLQIYNMI